MKSRYSSLWIFSLELKIYLEIDIRDEFSFEHLDIMIIKTHILIRHKDLRQMTPQHCFKRVDSLS